MTAAADAEACALVAAAADIICSLRVADLAGWTPAWHKPHGGAGEEEGGDGPELVAWPVVARGKRSRSSRGSPSASGSASASVAAKVRVKAKARRGARGSPPSPLDYSGGSGSGASTSGGEDGALCSPAPAPTGGGGGHRQVVAGTNKVGLARRLPVPPARPAGQRPRKKMRLPEIQQMVRSLSVENDALREEMKALQRACAALSKENGKLETRLDQSSTRNGTASVENKAKPQPDQCAAEQEAGNGFALPDLNLPAQEIADASVN